MSLQRIVKIGREEKLITASKNTGFLTGLLRNSPYGAWLRSTPENHINSVVVCAADTPQNVEVLTKSEYLSTVKEHRKDFIHRFFSVELNEVFKQLREDSAKMKVCHHEVFFVCPEHFDVDITEGRLCSYFQDLGYKTIVEPRKDNIRTITITLT